jgi:hypothetical protein
MTEKKYKRVPTRIHTRELDRLVAKTILKKRGYPNVNKLVSPNWRKLRESEV